MPFKIRILFNLGVKFLKRMVKSLGSFSENGDLYNAVDMDDCFFLLLLLPKTKVP